MIAGNNLDKFIEDIKYNLSEDDLFKIVQTKKALRSDSKRSYNKFLLSRNDEDLNEYYKKQYIVDNFEKKFMPGLYNSLLGHELQPDSHKSDDGVQDNNSKLNLYSEIDNISSYGKYLNGDPLSKMVESMYSRYSDIEILQDVDVDQSGFEKKMSAMTKDVENTKSDRDNKDNPLKDKLGYKELQNWLNKIEKINSKKKKMKQMEKISDLQRVSTIEFAKPRMMLMKKAMNNELYCRQSANSERYMHLMMDNSGSMGDYLSWRNSLIEKVFDDCIDKEINVESEFWNTDIYKSGPLATKKIKSKFELKSNVLSVSPDGNDRMGYCVLRRLKEMTKKKEKQYVLCISDGTGSIDDSDQRKEIERICISKNIDLKYALFSKNNEMHGTKKENIFYIYD